MERPAPEELVANAEVVMNDLLLPGSGPIVTSGESDSDNVDDDEEEDLLRAKNGNGGGGGLASGGDNSSNNNNNPVDFYDEDADDEDEAYVYRNLRSGTLEDVRVVASGGRGHGECPSAAVDQEQPQQQQHLKALKPRHSDAVLSCPCCFNIVCMDCQRHERYADQYRAMFVMGIAVKWTDRLRYDDTVRGLVPVVESSAATATPVAPSPSSRSAPDHAAARGAAAAAARKTGGGGTLSSSNVVPPDPVSAPSQEEDGRLAAGESGRPYYYKVCCAGCETQVAALDMTDEVYHFYGCLASS